MLDFKNFYSQEQYQVLLKQYQESKEQNRKEFFDAMYSFIKENIEQGYIIYKPVTTHQNHIIHQYNDLFELKNNNCEHLFSNLIVNFIILNEIYNYHDLSELITSGNIPSHLLTTNEKCQDCDQYLVIGLKNWQPELLVYDEQNGKIPPKECVHKSNQSLTIEFKTPELLIADWFRIKEFTDIVEYNKDYKLPSLCSFAGRVNSAKYFIEEQGFVHIQLTNCYPTVITNGKDILFGDNQELESDDDEELLDNLESDDEDIPNGYTGIGSVCCDLWAVTIIEKQKLIDILSVVMNLELAHHVVNTYIEDENILQYNIEPGKYQVEFNGDFKDFHEKSGSTLDFNTYFSIKQIKGI